MAYFFSAWWAIFCLYVGPFRLITQIFVASLVAVGCYRNDIFQLYRNKYFSFFSWVHLYLIILSFLWVQEAFLTVKDICPVLYPSLPSKLQNLTGYDSSFFQIWIPAGFSLLAYPFIYTACYWLGKRMYPWIRQFFRSWNLTEKSLFFFYSLMMTVLLIWATCQTYIWTCPGLNYELSHARGTLFGTDTIIFSKQNTTMWSNPRHPLYLRVEIPFQPIYYFSSLCLRLFSKGFYTDYYALWTSMAIGQILQWGIVLVMLKKMLPSVLGRSLSIVTIFLLGTSFSCTIYAMIPERLTLTTFTLVTYLYFYIMVVLQPYYPDNRKSQKWVEYILAVNTMGSTILSGIVVLGSILVRPYQGVRDFFRTNFSWEWMLILLFIVPIIFSRDSYDNTARFIAWGAIEENSLQFLHFAESCVFGPDYQFQTGNAFAERMITSVWTAYLWTGGIILGLCCIGFWADFRNRFVLVAFLWLLLGYGVMGICGWGGAVNEMSLYCPYYSWAVVPLAVCGLRRCLGDQYHQTTLLVLLFAGVALVMNLHTIFTVTQTFREICPWP